MNVNMFDDFKKGNMDSMYRELFPGMMNYTKKYINHAYGYLAEDYVQNAILLAWERRSKFSNIYELKSFIYTTIRNQIISLYRKNNAKLRYESQLEDEHFFNNSLIDQETQTILFNAINLLPAKERIVFEMSFIDGLKNTSIAQVLGVSDSTIQKQKASALRILKEKLGGNFYLLTALASFSQL